jgi:hypothetical protein
MFDSKRALLPAAFNNWWRHHRRFETMILAALDSIHPGLMVTNDANFGSEFEHIIDRALTTPRWRERRHESRVNKQYLVFKANNPHTKVNRTTREAWQDHIDIRSEDKCESIHSYHDTPPEEHEDECLFKPPDALEEDVLTYNI